jgi:predicted Zn-dependent peptidase
VLSASLPARLPAALLLGALALGAVRPAEAQEENVTEIVLENGMKVLLYPRPGDPRVACGWIAKVGSANERPGITGLAHLFEHMMFKGTRTIGTTDIERDLEIRGELRELQADLERRERLGKIPDASDPAARTPRHQELLARFDALLEEQKGLIVDNEFDQLYTKAGGTGLNAGTSTDWTIYFVNLPANKLELWFWLESDRLIDPIFRQFYSERDVVWEERRMRTDSTPTGKLDEEFNAMFWKASPYSWETIGWPSDLDTITREEALAFFERNYSPNNLTAALVGDFDVGEVEALARKYFARIPRSPRPPTPVRTFDPPQEGVKRLEGVAETRPTVQVRWQAFPYGHVDQPALDVLVELLNGRTGRLYRSLVEGQEVATRASAQLDARRYGGYVQLSGVASPEHSPEQVEQALYGEIRKLQEELVGQRELQKVQNQVVASKARRLSNNFFILFQLLLYDGNEDWREMFREADRLLAVTPQDIQAVAKKYFPMEARTIAVYRTKETDEAADPLWAALTPEQQQMAGMMKQRLAAIEDPAQLEMMLGQISAQAAMVPPEQKAVMDWVVSFLKGKLAKLESAGGES